MMKNQQRVSKDRVCMVSLVMIGVVIALSGIFDFYYDLNDDTVIKDIISGAYTGEPSGYSVQMLYPLSWLLALCYRAIPGVAWYGLFLCLCQFGALAMIAYRVTKVTKTRVGQITIAVITTFLGVGLLIRELVIVQYSVTSGICMAAAIFMYITNDKSENVREALRINAVAIILVVVSFMIRTEMCLMLFPFLLLAGLSRWSEERPMWTLQVLGKHLSVLGMALLCMGVTFGIDKLAYSQGEWGAYRDFFDARTKLYDFYDIPSYEEHQEFYAEIGLSRESYTLLQNYNFALDEDINAEMLEQIVEYQEKLAKTGSNQLHVTGGILITKKSLKEGIWLYKEHLLQVKDDMWGYLIAVGYVFCIIFGMRNLKSGLCWKVMMLLVIRSVLWIYLCMVDRMLSRITVPLLLGEVCILFGLLWRGYHQHLFVKRGDEENMTGKTLEKWQGICAVCVITLCGISAWINYGPKVLHEYQAREAVNPRWETMLSYVQEHEDDFYLVDVYSSTSYQGTPYAEKIFENVDNSYRNWDLCGGWLVKSPLTEVKYNGIQQKVYFVATPDKDLTWFEAFYAKKGQKITLKKADEMKMNEETIFYVYAIEAL